MRIAVSQFSPGTDTAANAAELVAAAARAAGDGAALLLAPEGSIVSFLTDPAAPGRAAQPLDGPFVSTLATASTAAWDCDRGRHLRPGPGVGPRAQYARRRPRRRGHRGVPENPSVRRVLLRRIGFDRCGAERPPVIEIDGVAVGFATCYDLRFPELFQGAAVRGRARARARVRVGKGPLKEEHWLTLLRARAIENTCYMVAADQSGRAGIGRSAAFDPFGLPLLDLGSTDISYGLVDVSSERVAEVRKSCPAPHISVSTLTRTR